MGLPARSRGYVEPVAAAMVGRRSMTCAGERIHSVAGFRPAGHETSSGALTPPSWQKCL